MFFFHFFPTSRVRSAAPQASPVVLFSSRCQVKFSSSSQKPTKARSPCSSACPGSAPRPLPRSHPRHSSRGRPLCLAFCTPNPNRAGCCGPPPSVPKMPLGPGQICSRSASEDRPSVKVHVCVEFGGWLPVCCLGQCLFTHCTTRSSGGMGCTVSPQAF